MIPDFTFDSFTVSRAIFVIYKNINMEKHKKALGESLERVIDRNRYLRW